MKIIIKNIVKDGVKNIRLTNHEIVNAQVY